MKHAAETWEKVRAAVMGGMGMKEAGELYGVGSSAVFMHAKRQGWRVKEVRKAGRGTRNVELIKRIRVKAEEVAESLAREKSEVQKHRETMLVLSMASRRSLAEAIRKAMQHLSGLSEEQLLKEHRALASFANAAEALFGWRALAVVEGEAAVREVRAQNGERDTRAINVPLIRTSPEQLRLMARAKGGVVAGEAGGIGRQSQEAPG